MFNKQDYYCIDGFPKEGLPCVVVMPPPFRQGFVYQGIKPAVIVLGEQDSTEQIREHVRRKQESLLEKIKLKRASSLQPTKEESMVMESPMCEMKVESPQKTLVKPLDI